MIFCFLSFFFFICKDVFLFFFFFQAEDGIRDKLVTGVQTCALPISRAGRRPVAAGRGRRRPPTPWRSHRGRARARGRHRSPSPARRPAWRAEGRPPSGPRPRRRSRRARGPSRAAPHAARQSPTSEPPRRRRQNQSAPPTAASTVAIAPLFGRIESSTRPGTAPLAFRFAIRLPTCQTVQPRTALRLFTSPMVRGYTSPAPQ